MANTKTDVSLTALMKQTNISAIEAAISLVENSPNKAAAVERLQAWLERYKTAERLQ